MLLGSNLHRVRGPGATGQQACHQAESNNGKEFCVHSEILGDCCHIWLRTIPSAEQVETFFEDSLSV
jgi:hypothetical protein